MPNWIGLVVIAWGVLAPIATYGLADLRAKLITVPNAEAAAVRSTTDELNKAFNKRLADIQAQLAEKAAEARRLAEEAEQSIGPTPVEKAELIDLCQKSASCRERNQKGETNQ